MLNPTNYIENNDVKLIIYGIIKNVKFSYNRISCPIIVCLMTLKVSVYLLQIAKIYIALH